MIAKTPAIRDHPRVRRLEALIAEFRDSLRMGLDPKKMRALRKKRRLTMEEAGKMAGMNTPKQTWYRYESGRQANVKLDKAEAIARALRVTVNDLLK